MQTFKQTSYQTLEANARKLEDLALFYATTGAAEAMEAGRTPPQEAQAHRDAGSIALAVAERLTKDARGLRTYLTSRREEDSRPAILKK